LRRGGPNSFAAILEEKSSFPDIITEPKSESEDFLIFLSQRDGFSLESGE
jgi:hypothetical protein